MSLLEIYNLLEDIQNRVGCGCRVSIFIPIHRVLSFQIDWVEEDLHFRYSKSFDSYEFKYIKDIKILSDWLVFMATKEYKLRTVGEE